mmetsp:Transcript_830/g.3246  ORF Transcript_830/g.3246 Transcript_830/m.3246 type:complete len:261 (+) Transcript_830:342-1124(+)
MYVRYLHGIFARAFTRHLSSERRSHLDDPFRDRQHERVDVLDAVEDVQRQRAEGGVDEREDGEHRDELADGDRAGDEDPDDGERQTHGGHHGGEHLDGDHRADDAAPSATPLEQMHAGRDDAEDGERERDGKHPDGEEEHHHGRGHVSRHERPQPVPRLDCVREVGVRAPRGEPVRAVHGHRHRRGHRARGGHSRHRGRPIRERLRARDFGGNALGDIRRRRADGRGVRVVRRVASLVEPRVAGRSHGERRPRARCSPSV